MIDNQLPGYLPEPTPFKKAIKRSAQIAKKQTKELNHLIEQLNKTIEVLKENINSIEEKHVKERNEWIEYENSDFNHCCACKHIKKETDNINSWDEKRKCTFFDFCMSITDSLNHMCNYYEQ